MISLKFKLFFNKKETETFTEMMISFAKIHVEKALIQASRKAELDLYPEFRKYTISEISILNAYPIENIK